MNLFFMIAKVEAWFLSFVVGSLMTVDYEDDETKRRGYENEGG